MTGRSQKSPKSKEALACGSRPSFVSLHKITVQAKIKKKNYSFFSEDKQPMNKRKKNRKNQRKCRPIDSGNLLFVRSVVKLICIHLDC